MTAGRVAAVLLLVSAALFSIGVAIERRESSHEAFAEIPAGREGAEGHESSESAEHDHGEEVAFLGADLESPWTVGAAVATSAGLAVGLWVSSRRWLAVVAAAFAVGFAALDIDELVHQLTEHRAWLVAVAVLLTVGHFAAGALAGTSSRTRP